MHSSSEKKQQESNESNEHQKCQNLTQKDKEEQHPISLKETDNPTECQFPRGLPENNTDKNAAFSTHHPLIRAYVALAAAVLQGEDNCGSYAASYDGPTIFPSFTVI